MFISVWKFQETDSTIRKCLPRSEIDLEMYTNILINEALSGIPNQYNEFYWRGENKSMLY